TALTLLLPGWVELAPWLLWQLLALAVLADAARRGRSPWPALMACAGVWLLASAAWCEILGFAGYGWLPLLWLGLALAAWLAARGIALFRPVHAAGPGRALAWIAQALPLLAVALTLVQYDAAPAAMAGRDSLVLLLAAAGYGVAGYRQRRILPLAGALLLANLALLLFWRQLGWTDPQLYLIPLGLSILALRGLLASRLPTGFHRPLEYLGALTILVSPVFDIATGSWLHIFTLMLCAVSVILLAIGLRLRALLYSGSAFLAAAVAAAVVRGGIDRPDSLWLAGLVLGAAVVTLGALAERHREQLLARLRQLAAVLAQWS
ncbi:MAG: hypothetical protein R3202_11005, partial [Candidatus Competibacterales bacterium]|nr:hypothetical protein [Candidatus Competibacterales bacterium]